MKCSQSAMAIRILAVFGLVFAACVASLACAQEAVSPQTLKELGEQPFPGVEIPLDLDRAAVRRALAGGLPYESRGVWGMGPETTPEQVRSAIQLADIPAIPGPVQETWQSIHDHYHPPAWLVDGKFGIFIHFGLYSIPGVNEWYQKYMYSHGEIRAGHMARFGPLDQFGYKNFIPLFALPNFDPDEWATLFKQSGARWVMPTAEHHDGFSLWDSQVNRFNSVLMGPKRDFIGELGTAVRRQEMKFGVTNHTIEHYDFIEVKNIPNDVPTDLNDPEYADFYWVDHSDKRLVQHLANWLTRNVELIDKYQPDLMWFDNGLNHRMFDPLKLKVAACYFNRAAEWHKDVTLTGKGTNFIAGAIQDFEDIQRAPTEPTDFTWMVHDRLVDTWGWSENAKITDTAEIICRLVKVVSCNGVYALNVAPKGDGSIPENQQHALREIGEWLSVNGEGIYGTRAWAHTRQDEDIDFTAKDQAIYVFFSKWPENGTLSIRALSKSQFAGNIAKVELLGSTVIPTYAQSSAELKIALPSEKPHKYMSCIKIGVNNLK